MSLAALGWAGVILGDGSAQSLTMVLILAAASGMVYGYPAMQRISVVLYRRRRLVHIREVRQDPFTTFWLYVERYIPHIRRIRESYARYLRHIGGNLQYDYDMHARRATHLALTVSPLCVIPVVTGQMGLIMIMLSPLVILYPMIQLYGRVKQHAAQVGEEMSFFLCYLTTMQGVGYTLYTSLDRIRYAKDIFVAMSRDAASITWDVTLGRPHIEALRAYAAKHPVPAFKDFLHGYISKHETVGPVPSYTEAKTGQFFESYKETWNNYKQTAIMLAAMTVMVSVMIPVMMVMMIFISTPNTIHTVLTIGPAMGPMLGMMLLFMVSSSQPSTGVKLKPWLPAIGVGVGAAILTHMVWMTILPVGSDIWDTEPGVTISVGFVAAGLANYIMVRRQLGGASNVDRGLPEFLEDVTEQTMAGSAISAILRQQARGGIYSGLFARLLRGIVAKLEMGATMEEACVEARKHSRYLAFVLFIIIRLQEIGSTSPTVLQQMTHFMSNIVSTKVEVERSLRMGAVMIYVAPLMLMGIMNAMFSVFAESHMATTTLTTILPPGIMDGFGPPDPNAGYRERLGLLAALLTCPMGLVAAKITKFTAVNTIPVVIVGSVNAAAILFVPIIIEALNI